MANKKRWIALSIILGALASVVVATVTVSALSQKDAPPQDMAQIQGTFGTGFTYQGRLDRHGEPVDDDCQMAFRLYDQAAGGSQVGATISATVPISAGLFTIKLDFGSGVFASDARWLGIQVLCPGDSAYADLGRQELTASPYALYAASTGALQGNPVTTTVPAAGQVLEWDGSAWGPGADDDTTYTAGTGLDLGGGAFSITPTYRLPQSCSGGQIAEWDGSTWQCGGDDDTMYTAGTGLGLGGDVFSITPTYRLPQSCSGGQIAEWNGSTWQCGSDDVGAGTTAWALTGNSGTIPGTHFLGTTDRVSLTLAVSGTAALRLVPNDTSPNLIGGYSGNSAAGSRMAGATIGGGGSSGQINQVTGNFGTVAGGQGNTAAYAATAGGGQHNTAGGGNATVGGGYENSASGSFSTVGGGQHSTAGGGNATVGGGYENSAGGIYSTVGGGYENSGGGIYSTIGGGWDNTAGPYGTVGGGVDNQAGFYGAIPGGENNTASGPYSFAAGRRAKAPLDGCFVWGDSTNADVTCNDYNRAVFRSSGGFYIYTNSTLDSGMYLSSGGSSWNAVSDRARKENFAPVDTQALLADLAEIPITTWNYKSQNPSARHIGPMAQDFNGLLDDLGGEGEAYINTLDADGVALAAIQGLYQMAQEKDARIATLEAENDALQAENEAQQEQIDTLDTRLAALEAGSNDAAPSQASSTSLLPWAAVLLTGFGLAWALRRQEGLIPLDGGGR